MDTQQWTRWFGDHANASQILISVHPLELFSLYFFGSFLLLFLFLYILRNLLINLLYAFSSPTLDLFFSFYRSSGVGGGRLVRLVTFAEHVEVLGDGLDSVKRSLGDKGESSRECGPSGGVEGFGRRSRRDRRSPAVLEGVQVSRPDRVDGRGRRERVGRAIVELDPVVSTVLDIVLGSHDRLRRARGRCGALTRQHCVY